MNDLFDRLTHPCLGTIRRVMDEAPTPDRTVWAMMQKRSGWCRSGGGGAVAVVGYGVIGRGRDFPEAAQSWREGAAAIEAGT